MKILQCIGTRPNLVKFINITGKDVVCWTGQHYDEEMMVRKVKIDYSISSTELGVMITAISDIIKSVKPDYLVVYGDTRSAVAGAIAGSDKGVKVVHIEAGLRCGSLKRPEERNRRLIDSLSAILLCPTESAKKNCEEEKLLGSTYNVGDLHYDRYCQGRNHAGYTLFTLHREEHTEDKKKLGWLIGGLKGMGTVIFPVHPRTRKRITEWKIKVPKNVKVISPMSYEEMQIAIKEAKAVMTDSGGLSREAFFAGTPVLPIGIYEWPEINCFGEGDAEGNIRNVLRWEMNNGQRY